MEKASRKCKAARRKAGISVAELAKASGCTERTVRNIEAGSHEPSYRLVMRIIAACEREEARHARR